MQNAINMKLTDKQTQEIVHADFETLKEILHECADQFMSVDDYKSLTGMKPRTIYDHIKKGKINSTTFCGHRIIHM